MALGAVVPLETRVYAEDGTRVEPFLSYVSSDPSVASVNRFGSVTALAAGYARIEVRVVDRPVLRATFGALVRDRYSKLPELNPCLGGPFAAGCHLHRSGEQLFAIVQQVCPSNVLTTTFGEWSTSGSVDVDDNGQVLGTGTGTIAYRAELRRPD